MDGPRGPERRAHPRAPYETQVALVRDGDQVTVASRDLGFGGMYFLSEERPEIGEAITARWVDGGVSYELDGRVIRHGGDGFAIAFTRITDAGEMALRDLLKRLLVRS